MTHPSQVPTKQPKANLVQFFFVHGCFRFRLRTLFRPKKPQNLDSGKRRVLSGADLKPSLELILPKQKFEKNEIVVGFDFGIAHRKMILTQNFSLIEKKKIITFRAREKSNGANCLLGNSLFRVLLKIKLEDFLSVEIIGALVIVRD